VIDTDLLTKFPAVMATIASPDHLGHVNRYGIILFRAQEAREMAVTSEFEHAERIVGEVAVLSEMAAGRLDEPGVRTAARILLEHRRSELPSVSVAVAAQLLQVSRTTVEAWRREGVLTPAVRHRRHEVTVDSLIRVQALVSELRQLGRIRELRDYVWWSAHDDAEHADGQLAEALRQLRAGELADEYVPSADDLEQASRLLGHTSSQEDT